MTFNSLSVIYLLQQLDAMQLIRCTAWWSLRHAVLTDNNYTQITDRSIFAVLKLFDYVRRIFINRWSFGFLLP